MGKTSKPPADSATILLVEDNDLVRDSTALCLENLKYRVRSAIDGPEALKILDSGEPVDILLSDVVMPGGMTGAELADAALRARPDLRILLISGYPKDDLVADGKVGGATQVLTKPVRMADLAKAIREIIVRAVPDPA